MTAPEAETGISWPLLTVIALFLVAWLLINPFGEFPINDDWAYSFGVRSILDSGQFRLTGFSAPNLIAQAYWGALFCLPFGFSQDALRLSTLVAAVGGLWAAYGVMRELGAGRLFAALAAGTLACSPLYLVLSASFMTDVPFTTLCSLSFWLYLRGVRLRAPPLWLCAYVVAFIALFVRQFALFLPVGFGAALVLRRGLRVSTAVLAAAPVLAFSAAHVLFQFWMLSTGRTPQFAQAIDTLSASSIMGQLGHIRFYVVAMLPYFGLSALPFLAACLVTRRWRRETRLWVATAVLGAGLCMLLATEGEVLPSLGNVINRYGIGPLTLTDTFVAQRNLPIRPNARLFWIPLTIAASFGTALLLTLVGRSLPGLWLALRGRGGGDQVWQSGMFLMFIAGYVLALLAAVTLDNLFDRYVVPLITPISALMFLWLAPDPASLRRRIPWAIAPGIASLVLSILAVHDYFGFNRARWAALAGLQGKDIPVDVIDGGFEFNGLTRYESGKTFKVWLLDSDSYTISLGPVNGFTAIAANGFPHWLWPPGYAVQTMRRNDVTSR